MCDLGISKTVCKSAVLNESKSMYCWETVGEIFSTSKVTVSPVKCMFFQ